MEGETVETKIENARATFPNKNIFKFSAVISLAFTVGYIHYNYVSTLFENVNNFSHLSAMEREILLRTEMGFYYSYFKTIVEEKSFVMGIANVLNDKLVEHPDQIDAFKRFNIHPEIFLGSLYRALQPYMNTSSYKECHVVHRGEGLTTVESCVGIGEPIYFYLQFIWMLSGLKLAALFLHATTLSHSILGGLVSVGHYFANHSETTRVQWAPNERENLAVPLLLLQAWLITVQLRGKNRKLAVPFFPLQIAIIILNALCLVCWQFTQFIFVTQTAIFLVMEQLYIIDIKTFRIFLHSHFWGLHIAILLLNGNDMLVASIFTSYFLVVLSYSVFQSRLRYDVKRRIELLAECFFIVIRLLLSAIVAFFVKQFLASRLSFKGDEHIWDFLYSKFTNFKHFHTMLYTCSDVFDFLPWSTVRKLCLTFLIPSVIVSIINVLNYWAAKAIKRYTEREIDNTTGERDGARIVNNSDDAEQTKDNDGRSNVVDLDVLVTSLNDNGHVSSKCDKTSRDHDKTDEIVEFLSHVKVDAAIFYNISQMVVYGVMAALVMRLKLLFVTQMCIVCSLIMNIRYYVLPKWCMKGIPLFWLVLVCSLVAEIVHNVALEKQHHLGEFLDMTQEQLLEWIQAETGVGEAFAGSMPTLATVMLVTRRPIVAHPHYEHEEARKRAYSVYKVYGRFSPQELFEELTKLRASYLIVEPRYCYGRSDRGCTFKDIWDVEAPTRCGPQLCDQMLKGPVEHFYPLFRNDDYAVFRIHDFGVRYMPRSFDT